MFSSFRREDPLHIPEIAIMVGVAQQVACIGLVDGATPKETTVGYLTLIAFYYLLRVGDYTRKKRRDTTRKIQSSFGDVAFKKDNTILSRDASYEELIEATAGTLRLSNQNNGVRGAMVHCSAIKGQ